jgi:hypothetical protein
MYFESALELITKYWAPLLSNAADSSEAYLWAVNVCSDSLEMLMI